MKFIDFKEQEISEFHKLFSNIKSQSSLDLKLVEHSLDNNVNLLDFHSSTHTLLMIVSPISTLPEHAVIINKKLTGCYQLCVHCSIIDGNTNFYASANSIKDAVNLLLLLEHKFISKQPEEVQRLISVSKAVKEF